MEPRIYCGASSRHIHCENYNFKVGEALKIFGDENPNEMTTWLDLRKCTGTIDSTSLSLLPAMSYLNITESIIEILPKAFESLPKLKSIDFRNTKTSINKEIFEGSKIKQLYLENLSIPDDCFYHLKSLDNLTFENCKLKKFDASTLSNLEYLSFQKCQIEVLDDFHSCIQKLENLFIMENKIGEINFKAILKLINLKWLARFGNETTSAINYEEFQKLPKLETILFENSVYKNINFSSFPNLKQVQIGSYTDIPTDEDNELMEKLKNLNLVFQLQYCGPPKKIDLTKVMICA
ncbi:unnamed protein product [Psylliodes chrysocephalus]|uniref:Uncharacterized protein n=1 Tax=Psylliodes chrysocephalus TaxID=3402493 RepID=A0A9P0GBE3_9CUCU|nr:unnamed protein product [Psylliodes chrysocephala]